MASFPTDKRRAHVPAAYATDSVEGKMTQLARELACGLSPIDDVLTALGITQDEYTQITRNAKFPTLLAQFKLEWEKADNTAARVKLKSALALEQAIPEMHGQLHNKEAPLAARVSLFAALGKFAGLGAVAAETGGGEGFRVVINIGSDKRVQFDAALPSPVIEGEVVG